MLKTSDFFYELPPEQIAQTPAEKRDASRLMVYRLADGTWEHRGVSDLPGLLRAGDLLVTNNTRVIPCRLFLRRPGGGGLVEIVFLEVSAAEMQPVLIRARRKLPVGEHLEMASGEAVFEVMSHGERGEAVVRVKSAIPLETLLERDGAPPLPPYIKRPAGVLPADRERYQTVYAKHSGSVAAPTAGLHFTPRLLEALANRGIGRVELTLHFGLGTFRPVTVENPDEHRMEKERYDLPASVVDLIRETRAAGGRVIAVGSTSVRTLEGVALKPGGLQPGSGRVDLFIRPPFAFQVVQGMMTNFHLPESTLLMMVCALGGRDRVLAAYREAVREGYRFFSYGDAMLLL